MSAAQFITARESPGGPPPGLGQLGKMRWAAKNPPADPTVSFKGRTVLVTGANTGLGFEAAVKYATLGADKLFLGVRSAQKGEAAKQQIIQRSGRQSADIIVLTVDLGSFESVQKFVQALSKETPKLHVALLNAGLGNPTLERSPTGWEMALQINVLSTALMAVLLLPLLRAASPDRAHLTFVNSFGHELAQREWFSHCETLLKTANFESNKWDAQKSYVMVKLLAIAVMQALAKNTASRAGPQPQIIVNAVCPSQCKTDLGRKFGMGAKILMMPFQALFARSAEEGARSLVSATALGTESHGRFWHNDILAPFGPLAQDEGFMRQAWSEVFEVIAKTGSDLQKILDNVDR